MSPDESLRKRVWQAYGGEAWAKASAVEVVLSASGPGFFLKGRRAFHRVRMQASLSEPRLRIEPINKQGQVGVLDGVDVRIERPDGSVVAKRKNPRRFFPGGRRALYWDDLDHAYFAGYASWNYLVFPSLLLRNDIRWSEPEPWTLVAEFPDHIPTHSARQAFHIDPVTQLVRQHDYTAEVFGSWAKAAHIIFKHVSFDGIPVPVEREARPLLPGGLSIPGLYVIRIRVHEWRLL